jgi:hypothetical protein
VHRALPLLAVTCLLAACGGDDEKQASTSPEQPSGSMAGEGIASPPATGREGSDRTPDAPGQTTEGDAAATPEAPATGREARRTCLQGGYVSSSFRGSRSFDSPFGQIALSGRGRGLGLTFEGSRWTFRGVGSRPMRGRALGIKGTLKVNGSSHGRLVATPGGGVRFRTSGTRGTVTLAGLGTEFELPVSVVDDATVPEGPAKVSCGGARLTIDSRSGVLRMNRAR